MSEELIKWLVVEAQGMLPGRAHIYQRYCRHECVRAKARRNEKEEG